MRTLCRIILTVTILIMLGLTLYNMDDVTYNADGTTYIVDEYVDTYYEMLSDNVGLTTINGISNVYVNMKSDGYKVYKEDIQSGYVDVIFTKDDCPTYRYYFTYPDGRITIFSSEYESSYLGVSYISERKE